MENKTSNINQINNHAVELQGEVKETIKEGGGNSINLFRSKKVTRLSSQHYHTSQPWLFN